MQKIKSIKAREILDSRATPTIETRLELDDGTVAIDSVPSGASVGKYEALELRDNDPGRYGGLGVLKAVNNVNNVIAPKIVGMDIRPQLDIDRALLELDATENKSNLGANAMLSVSEAVCRAGAMCKGVPLYIHIGDLYGIKPKEMKMPIPMLNLINGGKHGAGNLDFQEFHLLPDVSGGFSEAIRIGAEIYYAVKAVLIRHGAIHSVGDEGGFAPNLFTNADALEVIAEAIKSAGYELGRQVYLGLDVAATTFYKDGQYVIKDRTMSMDTDELVSYYRDLLKQYLLQVLEDPFAEDDWQGWSALNAEIKEPIIIGDDLLATNKNRIAEAIKRNACRGVIVKPNQIGTVAETIEVIKIAKQASWQIAVSHRSGESNDSFIADFCIGVNADFAKFGALARGERVAKYNRLVEIEQELK